MERSMFEEMDSYGSSVYVYNLCYDGIGTNLVIVRAEELCNLDDGVELFRTTSDAIPADIKYQGSFVDFDMVITTPECRALGEKIANRYRKRIEMLFE